MLEFEEDKHIYRLDGKVLPSVTTIISPLTKLWISGDQLEKARQEGRAVHRTVELACKKDLDSDALPAWLRPYLCAWEKFVEFSGFELVASELRGCDPVGGYAGTLDLDGIMHKVKGGPFPVLIDIKRSLAAAPAIGVQLAGYQGFVTGPRRRFGLQLREDGEYRLKEFADPSDRSVFLACLVLHRWRERQK